MFTFAGRFGRTPSLSHGGCRWAEQEKITGNLEFINPAADLHWENRDPNIEWARLHEFPFGFTHFPYITRLFLPCPASISNSSVLKLKLVTA